MAVKKINIEEIALKQFSNWTYCEKIWIKNAMLDFAEQLLELAAENALTVDYVEQSMDKDVYSEILNTINQIE